MPLSRTLEVVNLQVMKWWVDASFAVHPDMKFTQGKDGIWNRHDPKHVNSTELLFTKSIHLVAQFVILNHFPCPWQEFSALPSFLPGSSKGRSRWGRFFCAFWQMLNKTQGCS